jgi:hypothetical protein
MMTPTDSTTPKNAPQSRAERVISHALVEMRRYRWLPFGIKSAVLLDLSSSGFKAEFTGNMRCKPGDRFFMQIPLLPFGIKAPTSISCPVSIKWFDPKKMRVGGIFDSVTNTNQVYLNQIIEKVKAQGLGR